ncbi:MAG: hypothetical protein HQL74_06470 [Magnetococcales bacterium]|nr:hypothetical protein [Magnetococcales bacterium]
MMTDCKPGAQGNDQEYNEKGQFSGPLCHGDQTPTPTPTPTLPPMLPPETDPPHWIHNTPEMPPLIKARKDYLDAINRGKWQEFSRAIDKLPNVTESEKFRYMMIFGVEGMMKVSSNGTASGIQPETYRSYVNQGFFKPDPGHTVNEPKDLNIEERARYYRAFFNGKLSNLDGDNKLRKEERPTSLSGCRLLDSLGDMKTSAAIADVIFQFSPRGADAIFRTALGDNNVVKYDENEIKMDTWNRLVAKARDLQSGLQLRKDIALAREERFGGKENRGSPVYGLTRYTTFVHYWE